MFENRPPRSLARSVLHRLKPTLGPVAFAGFVAITACARTTASTDGVSDAGRAETSIADASGLDTSNGFDGTTPGEPVCPRTACGAGRMCCFLNGVCFDPVTERSVCPSVGMGGDGGVIDVAPLGPDGSWGSPSAPTSPPTPPTDRWCASNADCSPTQYCGGAGCLGFGSCVERGNCGFCSPTGTPRCSRCGCDGTTYPSLQAACAAGARVSSGSGTCGESRDTSDAAAGPSYRPCAADAHCPASESCCPVWGLCMPRSCATCCRFAPPGTTFPCRDNTECSPSQYCIGAGCGTPGGCARRRTMGDCTGELSPVCGCDGRSYTNACFASAAGTRVAHTGMCP